MHDTVPLITTYTPACTAIGMLYHVPAVGVNTDIIVVLVPVVALSYTVIVGVADAAETNMPSKLQGIGETFVDAEILS